MFQVNPLLSKDKSKKLKCLLQFLFGAFYGYQFRENIFSHFKGMERKRYVTDRQTERIDNWKSTEREREYANNRKITIMISEPLFSALHIYVTGYRLGI